MSRPDNPDLIALLADLKRVQDIAPDEVPGLLIQLAALQVALASRLPNRMTTLSPIEDRLLGVQEAARRLDVSPDYIYRHHHQWSFTVRSGRKLGFSEQGLYDYLRRMQRRA